MSIHVHGGTSASKANSPQVSEEKAKDQGQQSWQGRRAPPKIAYHPSSDLPDRQPAQVFPWSGERTTNNDMDAFMMELEFTSSEVVYPRSIARACLARASAQEQSDDMHEDAVSRAVSILIVDWCDMIAIAQTLSSCLESLMD